MEPNLDKIKVFSTSQLSNHFLGDVIEICIVTCNYQQTMEGLIKLGIGPWRVYTFKVCFA
jgi:hypothetical protein